MLANIVTAQSFGIESVEAWLRFETLFEGTVPVCKSDIPIHKVLYYVK